MRRYALNKGYSKGEGEEMILNQKALPSRKRKGTRLGMSNHSGKQTVHISDTESEEMGRQRCRKVPDGERKWSSGRGTNESSREVHKAKAG